MACSKCNKKKNKKVSSYQPPQPKMYYANSNTADSPIVSIGLKEDLYLNDKFFKVGSTVQVKQSDALKLMGTGAPIWII